MSGCEAGGPGLRCVLPFEAAPSEVGLLRRAATHQLDRWAMPVDADEAALLVTELATNVVKHVGEGVSAALILEWKGRRLRIEVHDKSHVMPELASLSCDEECGRGLHLLATLAADWGAARTVVGKSVWCELELGATQACRRLVRAAEVLESYRGNGGVGLLGAVRGAELEASAIELIADLLYWTAARGHDPDDILDQAQMHYEAEAGAV
ncbi:ATP-binding protein [Streptomyces echinatus]|uniref:ATP-binding protein n=1 Tax=Streptomyces echinatus TaxID=67293 RepID=UPI003787555C